MTRLSRYSLRTLLFVTTLVALHLGLHVVGWTVNALEGLLYCIPLILAVLTGGYWGYVQSSTTTKIGSAMCIVATVSLLSATIIWISLGMELVSSEIVRSTDLFFIPGLALAILMEVLAASLLGTLAALVTRKCFAR